VVRGGCNLVGTWCGWSVRPSGDLGAGRGSPRSARALIRVRSGARALIVKVRGSLLGLLRALSLWHNFDALLGIAFGDWPGRERLSGSSFPENQADNCAKYIPKLRAEPRSARRLPPRLPLPAPVVPNRESTASATRRQFVGLGLGQCTSLRGRTPDGRCKSASHGRFLSAEHVCPTTGHTGAAPPSTGSWLRNENLPYRLYPCDTAPHRDL